MVDLNLAWQDNKQCDVPFRYAGVVLKNQTPQLCIKIAVLLVGAEGFEPSKWWSQSPLPYRLATPHNQHKILYHNYIGLSIGFLKKFSLYKKFSEHFTVKYAQKFDINYCLILQVKKFKKPLTLFDECDIII